MKHTLAALLLACACNRGAAQLDETPGTNAIVFPELLSSEDVVLMTNAEYRGTEGRRIIFRNEVTYHVFDPTNLDASVLSRLGLSLSQLEEAQAKQDAFKQQYAEEVAQAQAQAQAAQQASRSRTNSEQPAVTNSPASKPPKPKPARVVHRYWFRK